MKGSNLTCAAILYTIQAYRSERGKLPSKLYIQMDNCSGDNKNHVVFGFLGHLVQLGVFKTIEVIYLDTLADADSDNTRGAVCTLDSTQYWACPSSLAMTPENAPCSTLTMTLTAQQSKH